MLLHEGVGAPGHPEEYCNILGNNHKSDRRLEDTAELSSC